MQTIMSCDSVVIAAIEESIVHLLELSLERLLLLDCPLSYLLYCFRFQVVQPGLVVLFLV